MDSVNLLLSMVPYNTQVFQFIEDENLDAKDVLIAIRGYVKHFFGCRECSTNFMQSAVHIEDRVRTADDAVLFLWRSHNKANKNLRGDLTEDPEHPKVQFPSIEQGPAVMLTMNRMTGTMPVS